MKIERQIEIAKEIAFDEDLPHILAKIARCLRVSMNAYKGNIELTTSSNSGKDLDVKFTWEEKQDGTE